MDIRRNVPLPNVRSTSSSAHLHAKERQTSVHIEKGVESAVDFMLELVCSVYPNASKPTLNHKPNVHKRKAVSPAKSSSRKRPKTSQSSQVDTLTLEPSVVDSVLKKINGYHHCYICARGHIEYQVVRNGDVIVLCSDQCLNKFKVPKRELGRIYCVQCFTPLDPSALAYRPIFGSTDRACCSEVCFYRYNTEKSPDFMCRYGKCKSIIGRISYRWQTMEFCKIDCVAKVLSAVGEKCFQCQTAIENQVTGKFTLRLGSNVRHFCSPTCKNIFHGANNLCKFCNSIINNESDRLFCSVLCNRLNQRMVQIREIMQLGGKKGEICDICRCYVSHEDIEKRFFFYKYIPTNENSFVFICSTLCSAAYRHHHRISNNICTICGSSSSSGQGVFYRTSEDILTFCNSICLVIYVCKSKQPAGCTCCGRVKTLYDSIEEYDEIGGPLKHYCSIFCATLMKSSEKYLNMYPLRLNYIKCGNCNLISPSFIHYVTKPRGVIVSYCSYQCYCLGMWKSRDLSSHQVEESNALITPSQPGTANSKAQESSGSTPKSINRPTSNDVPPTNPSMSEYLNTYSSQFPVIINLLNRTQPHASSEKSVESSTDLTIVQNPVPNSAPSTKTVKSTAGLTNIQELTSTTAAINLPSTEAEETTTSIVSPQQETTRVPVAQPPTPNVSESNNTSISYLKHTQARVNLLLQTLTNASKKPIIANPSLNKNPTNNSPATAPGAVQMIPQSDQVTKKDSTSTETATVVVDKIVQVYRSAETVTSASKSPIIANPTANKKPTNASPPGAVQMIPQSDQMAKKDSATTETVTAMVDKILHVYHSATTDSQVSSSKPPSTATTTVRTTLVSVPPAQLSGESRLIQTIHPDVLRNSVQSTQAFPNLNLNQPLQPQIRNVVSSSVTATNSSNTSSSPQIAFIPCAKPTEKQTVPVTQLNQVPQGSFADTISGLGPRMVLPVQMRPGNAGNVANRAPSQAHVVLNDRQGNQVLIPLDGFMPIIRPKVPTATVTSSASGHNTNNSSVSNNNNTSTRTSSVPELVLLKEYSRKTKVNCEVQTSPLMVSKAVMCKPLTEKKPKMISIEIQTDISLLDPLGPPGK